MADHSTLFETLRPVAEEAVDATNLASRLDGAREPFVVRGIARSWPLVRAGLSGAEEARAYLKSRARDRKFTVNIGAPGGL